MEKTEIGEIFWSLWKLCKLTDVVLFNPEEWC